MSLQRGEGSHAKNLLTQIAQAFPQAIYYSLRTMVLCLREFAFKVVQVSAHRQRNGQNLLIVLRVMPKIGFRVMPEISRFYHCHFKVVQVSAHCHLYVWNLMVVLKGFRVRPTILRFYHCHFQLVQRAVLCNFCFGSFPASTCPECKRCFDVARARRCQHVLCCVLNSWAIHCSACIDHCLSCSKIAHFLQRV